MLFAAVHEFASWHEADLPRSLLQVRNQVKSGRQVLKTSLSAFDPKRTCGPGSCRAGLGVSRLG